MINSEKVTGNLSKFIDSSIWYLFLILVFSVSFVNALYDSVEWYFISFCIFTLSAVVTLRILQHGAYNIKALFKAWPFVVLFSLSITLLLLQTMIPYESSFVAMINVTDGTGLDKADWFRPELVWSVTPHLTQQLFWSEVTMLMAFLLTITLVSNRQRLKQFLLMVTIVLLVHSLVGIGAKFANIFLVDKAQLDGHFSAARAWFINRNHFAAFIALILFAPMSYFFKWIFDANFQDMFKHFSLDLLGVRILIVISLFLSFIALSLSQSRSGFFAIFFSLSLVLVLFGRHIKLNLKRRYLFLPIMLMATVSLLYFGSDLLGRINIKSLSLTSLTNERFSQWQFTWTLIQNEWLLGYGGNSYSTVFQATREQGSFREVIFNQAHNDYLHIWFEQGLIGLLCWLAILVLALKNALTTFKASSSRLVAAVLISASAVIIASALQSSVGFNLQILNIRFYFFAIMALIFSVSTIKHN